MVSPHAMASRFPLWRVVFRLVLAAGLITAAHADPVITEFMASNTKTLADVDGDFSDWVEIYNPDATAVNLAGWYLTDNASKKTKWQFPAVTLSPGAHTAIVSGKGNATGVILLEIYELP